MTVTNDPTGLRSTCTVCGAEVEEALLFKGLRMHELDNKGRRVARRSPGMQVWRTLDRGHGCAVCPTGPEGRHQPGKITRHSAR